MPNGTKQLKDAFGTDKTLEISLSYSTMWMRTPDSNGKFTLVSATKSTQRVDIEDIMNKGVTTGVEFWKTATTMISQKVGISVEATAKLADTMSLGSKVVVPTNWIPSFKWEGDDLLQLNYGKMHRSDVTRTGFTVSAPLAKLFGFAKYDTTSSSWKLGPNAQPSHPVEKFDEDATLVSSKANRWSVTDTARQVLDTEDLSFSGGGTFTLFRVHNNKAYFTTACNWRFTLLNHSFEQALNVNEAVMVYSDLVQSTVVGTARFPLLHQVTI